MIVEEQELDFQQLLDFSLDAIFVIKENEIIYANKSALDLLGGNYKTLVGAVWNGMLLR